MTADITTISLKRRKVLRLGGATALAAPALILGRQAWSAPRKLHFSWNQSAFCLTPSFQRRPGGAARVAA